MSAKRFYALLFTVTTLLLAQCYADTNVLENPGFESGTTGWTARGCTFTTVSSPVYAGSLSGRASSRTDTWNGIQQNMLGKMVAGATYTVSGYVRTSTTASSTVHLSFVQTDGDGTNYHWAANGTATSTGWTYISGSFTLNVTGTLTELAIYVEGPASGVDIYLDDVVVNGPSVGPTDPEATGTVNIGTRYQTIEGFGAAGAWYEGTLVSLGSSQPQIYDILFGDLGLDIYRLRNGYDQDGAAGYMSDSSTIISEGEASLGRPLKVLISAWSPPAYLKSGNSTVGGTLIGGPSSYNYTGLADWWADSVTAWSSYGVDADYISIQNEPDWVADWDTCRYEPSETTSYAGYDQAFEAVYDEMFSRFGSSMPKMIGPEPSGFNGAAGSSLDDYLSAIDDHSHVYGYAHHLYNINAGDNPDAYLSAMLTLHNNWGSKPLFQTEYEKHSIPSAWPDAYNMALLLHNSLTVEELSGYLYWDLFWGGTDVGLVSISSSSYTINSDYYGFKQYSAFIHSGWQRVNITDDSDALRTSAYISPDNSQLTVVAINTSTDTDIELDLSFTGFTIQSGQVYRTSQTQNCVNLGSYSNPVTMPAQSVTTLSLVSGTIDTEPPAAPTGLSAMGGELSISLNWNDNTEGDLAGYNVYRSQTSGSGYTQINGSLVTASNYTDNSIDAYETYYYVVTAEDYSSNESGNSSQASASATDTTPPAAPTGLSAVPSDATVTLNWNDNTEGDLEGYNVYRSTTSGSGYAQLNGSLLTTSNYTDNSVTNGTTYYYVVTAEDTFANESNYSSQVSATPSPVTTYTFAGITAANTEYNAYACDVDVFPFAGSSGNRNSMVEATDAQYGYIATDDSTSWTTTDPSTSDEIFLWVEMKINEMPASISNIDLTFDGYTAGYGSVTHRIYVLTAGADWTQNASWTQVGSDQSISPGTFATMTRSLTSDFSSYIDGTGKITWAVYETTSSQPMHVNYLEMKVTGMVDTTPPAAPTGLAATAGDATVSLNWDDNGEGDLAGYNVKRSETSGSGYSTIATDVATSDYTDNTVTNGTTYYYVVTAVDTSDNESGNSSEDSATPEDTTAPAAPTGLNATAGDGTVSLNWDDNGETDLAGYNVKRSTTQGSGYSSIATDVATSDYADNTVANGTTYYYVITAVDEADNESGNSNEASATPVDTTPPAAPANLSASGSDGFVSLDWNDNSEPDLGGYNVYRSTTQGSGYSPIATDVTDSDYLDNAVTNGTTYYYVVTAVDNLSNESDNSNEASATPQDSTAPAAPVNLTAAAGNESVSLDWNDNIEPDLASYNIYRSDYSGGGYVLIDSTLAGDSQYVDNGATNFVTSYYVVTAVDGDDNESGNSNEASATPVYQTCADVQAAQAGLVSDLTGDCYVDLNDLQIITNYWLEDNCAALGDCEGADFGPDGDVDFEDYSDFAVDWFECDNPADGNCPQSWWPTE